MALTGSNAELRSNCRGINTTHLGSLFYPKRFLDLKKCDKRLANIWAGGTKTTLLYVICSFTHLQRIKVLGE